MKAPQVMMYSLWRNDADRNLLTRARHLTTKTYPNLRWVWVVGDSDDGTGAILREYAAGWNAGAARQQITVIEHKSGVDGAGHFARLDRLSASANLAYDQVGKADRWLVCHESDLLSPPDVVERLIATGKECVAGVTWLETGTGRAFYDIWGFWADGVPFRNSPPYHEVWRDNEPFRVDSFGEVWLVPAAPFRGAQGIRCQHDACREICGRLRRDAGAELWCDPRIEIIQPKELWTTYPVTVDEMREVRWK